MPEGAGIKVRLAVVEGPLAGREFLYEQHDVLLLGRDVACHLSLPDDPFVSRHHFAIEINPPRVSLRDLNSLNGTTVNGIRFGGRMYKGATGAGSADEPVILIDGDRIQVGKTTLTVAITQPPVILAQFTCAMCGTQTTAPDEGLSGADYLCDACAEAAENDPDTLLKTAVVKGARVQGKLGPAGVAGYRVTQRLGEGGMSTVYQAISMADGQTVVLKLLHSRLAARKQNRRTFLREMLVMASLKHTNIVQCVDYGAAGNTFFFVAEYCNSGSLSGFALKHYGKAPWATAMPLFLQFTEGLAHAHAQNIVHRDLKPDNVFLHQVEGITRAKVGDFGLAKIYTLAGMTQLTQPKEYAGSFLFMAKDQLLDFKFTKPAADVWSAAASMYNVLTGEFPREMPYDKDPIDLIMEDKIRPIEHWGVDVPPRLAGVINKGLASDPSRRYQDACELLAALKAAV